MAAPATNLPNFFFSKLLSGLRSNGREMPNAIVPVFPAIFANLFATAETID